MVVGDFNGEGERDLAFRGSALAYAVSPGKGNGSFKSPFDVQPTFYPRAAQLPVGDFK